MDRKTLEWLQKQQKEIDRTREAIALFKREKEFGLILRCESSTRSYRMYLSRQSCELILETLTQRLGELEYIYSQA